MDIRDILVDGIEQLSDWLDDGLNGLTLEQVNWLPEGKTVSIGFHAWHITRTADNIANFVFRKQPPIWLSEGYVDRFGLPKNPQGTGMPLDEARALQIGDLGLLREYGRKSFAAATDYVKSTSIEALSEVQMVRPLGEMPQWRVFRQVIMTHGFMHLGEINTNKGMLGIAFSV
ncbi:MAG: DinB family protein [Dehalococcoidia bacterium]